MIRVELDPELPNTVTIEQEPGLFFMTSRTGRRSVAHQLEENGDKAFDGTAHGSGSGRGLK